MQDSGTKIQKIERLKTLIPQSKALKKSLGMAEMHWAGVLAELDEEKIDDLLLILEEEHDLLGLTEEEKNRKRAVNKASYHLKLLKLNHA